MTSPEERRQAQISAIAESPLAIEVSPVDAYRRLIAYFDENEPALADAIRYGLAEVQFEPQQGPPYSLYGINYPPGHPKQ
jgi:hypothetical protein